MTMSSQVSAVTPTPEQLNMFMQLPKAQQEALAAQYGVDLNSLKQTSQTQQASPSLNELNGERNRSTAHEDSTTNNNQSFAESLSFNDRPVQISQINVGDKITIFERISDVKWYNLVGLCS